MDVSPDLEQGSIRWYEARRGKVTASRLKDVLSAGRGNAPSITRDNYMTELMVERLTGFTTERYMNAAMEWGIMHEQEAFEQYEFCTQRAVAKLGFIPHPRIPDFGASPDRAMADDPEGSGEAKCPNTATHVRTLLGAPIDPAYILQMQGQMSCRGNAWTDFVSYDPRLPLRNQLYIQRVERDETVIATLETAVRLFLEELEERMDRLAKMPRPGAIQAVR